MRTPGSISTCGTDGQYCSSTGATRPASAAARRRERVHRGRRPRFVRSVYFTDPNGIALEASWWAIDATGRPADYADERVFADPEPVAAIDELRRHGQVLEAPVTRTHQRGDRRPGLTAHAAARQRRPAKNSVRRARALGRPDAVGDRRVVVEPGVGAHVVERCRGPGLEVGGAVHEAADAGAKRGAGAHHARLERHDERAVVEPPRCRARRRRPAGRGSRRGRSGPGVRSRSLWRLGDRHAVAQRRPRRPARRRARGRLASSATSISGDVVHVGSRRSSMAEGVGFEPTVSCPTHAFQACRFGRSRIPPDM